MNLCCHSPAATHCGQKSSHLLRTHSCCGRIWMWVFRGWQEHHVLQFDLLETAPFAICSCSAASSGVSFICLSLRQCRCTHAHHTIGVSFLPIPVTRCYSKTETGRQYPVILDCRNTGTCLISEKWADPVKFLICGWEINIRIWSELFTQGAF